MANLDRKVFFTLQKISEGEFGLKRRDGFTLEYKGICFYVHEGDNDRVVFTDSSTGVSISTLDVKGCMGSLKGVDKAIAVFKNSLDNGLLENLKAWSKTPKYANLKKAYKMMLEVSSLID